MKKLNWKSTDTEYVGPEILAITRAEPDYLIGYIGGWYNLYRGEEKIALTESMTEAMETAQKDYESRQKED